MQRGAAESASSTARSVHDATRPAIMPRRIAPLHLEVAEAMRIEILRGDLPPGKLLDEPALCAKMAISRTPLREALKVLTAQGLLVHLPRQGTSVATLAHDDTTQLLIVGRILQVRCATEAAAASANRDLRALDDLFSSFAACGPCTNSTACVGRVCEIHDAIADLSGNTWLAREARRISGLLRLAAASHPCELHQNMEIVVVQRTIVEAIGAQDGQRAAAAMNRFFDELSRQFSALDIQRA